MRERKLIKVKVSNGTLYVENVDSFKNKKFDYGMPFGEKDISCVLWIKYYRKVVGDDFLVNRYIESLNLALFKSYNIFKSQVKKVPFTRSMKMWDPHNGLDVIQHDSLPFYNYFHSYFRKEKITKIKNNIRQCT